MSKFLSFASARDRCSRRRSSLRQAIALTAIACSLSACLSGAPPTRYLLEPTAVSGIERPSKPIDAIGVSSINVPGYIKESSIAVRGEGARLTLIGHSQWAEAPELALTRTLAESLRLRSGASVIIEPLPRGFDPQVRVEVTIDRLLAEPRGVADVSGQVRLISGDGRDLLRVLPFQILQRGRGGDFDGFFDALSISLDDLASLIIDAL